MHRTIQAYRRTLARVIAGAVLAQAFLAAVGAWQIAIPKQASPVVEEPVINPS